MKALKLHKTTLQATNELEPVPVPEMELEPEPEPETVPGQCMVVCLENLDFGKKESIKLAIAIFDDGKGRHLSRQVMLLDLHLEQLHMVKSAKGMSADVSILLSIDHFDQYHAASPVLEPCTVTMHMNPDGKRAGGKLVDLKIEPRIELIVTEALAIDLQRLKYQWKNKWEAKDTEADNRAAYAEIRNYTGQKLWFSLQPKSSHSKHEDIMLLAGEKQSLDHTETCANTHRPLEGLSGDLQLSLLESCSNERFFAPVSHSTVWYTAGTGTNRSFVDVSVEKNGQCTTISLAGLFSVRNGLRVEFTVYVAGHCSIKVPPGEERGLPIQVESDHDITVTYESQSGVKTFRFKPENVSSLRYHTPPFEMAADLQSCVRMVRSEHRVCCRPVSRPVSSGDAKTDFVWETATQVALHPALVIANMLPIAVNLVYECGDAVMAMHVTIEKGAMLDVNLHDPAEDVTGSVECAINGLCFGAREIQFTGETTESLTLTNSDPNLPSSPIELTLVHDVDPSSGVRVIRIIAPYWLINSGGLPVNLYNPGEDNQSSIPIASSQETRELDEVAEWITCDKGTTIFSPEGDTVELEIFGEKRLSKPFNVSAPASEGLLEVRTEREGAKQFGLVVSTRSHLGTDETAAFCRRLAVHPPIKIIKLSPRFVVLNHLKVDMCLRQIIKDTDAEHPITILKPGVACAVHMPDHEEHPSVQIRQANPMKMTKVVSSKQMNVNRAVNAFAHKAEDGGIVIQPTGGDWSGSFRCDSVDEFPLRVRQSPKDRIVRVRVSTEGASIFIHIAEENEDYPHFRVKNDAEGTTVTVRQAGSDDTLFRIGSGKADPMAELKPGESSILGWHTPFAEAKSLLQVDDEGVTKELLVCPLTYGKAEHDCNDLDVHVTVEGPTRVIVVSRVAPAIESEPEPEPEDAGTVGLPVLSRMTANVGGVGLCLVGHLLNGRRAEILALDLGEVNVEKTKFEGGEGGLEVKLESLQIDSMLSRASCPVVVKAHPGVGADKKSSLHLSLGTIEQPVKWAKHFSAIVIVLQALELNVEYAFVSQLMRWSRAVKSEIAIQLTELEDPIANESRDDALKVSMLRKTPDEEKVIFVRHFQLHPIKLTLTAELGQADEAQGLDIASAFGWVDVDEAPIRLSGLQLDNLLGAQAQVRKVTRRILGNPIGLVNKLGSGITMFFYEPIQGIQQGPEHFVIGVAKGTTGLVSSTVEGVFMAPAAVAGALAEGLGQLGSDSHAAHGDKVHTLVEGLQFAGEDLKHDLYMTTTSIFVAPYHGAVEGGAVGFAKGLGTGVGQTAVGAASTVVDLTKNLTAGLSHLLSAPLSSDEVARLRLPRVVHRGGVCERLGLESGNERRLKGQAIVDGMRHVGMMEEMDEFGMTVEGVEVVVDHLEYYNDHMETTQDGQWVLLTDLSLLLIDDVDADETVSAEEVKWRLGLDSIINLVVQRQTKSSWGVEVHMIKADGTADAESPRVIAMRTETAANQLVALLEAVVDAPVDEAWAVPVVGGHLRPELRGMTDLQAMEAIREAQEEQARREKWLEAAAKQRCCFVCKVYCGYIFCCGFFSSAPLDDDEEEEVPALAVVTDGGAYSQVPTVSEDDDAIGLLAPGVGRSDSAP